MLYITIGKVSGGQPPIVESHGSDHANSETLLFASIGEVDSVAQSSSEVLYSNPLPHVLILTAIVVGVATLAIGLSLVVRVREVYGTIVYVFCYFNLHLHCFWPFSAYLF